MRKKKYSIGYRTVKTAIGIAVSIGLAKICGLDYYTSAGILTILCIQTTKRKSVHAIYTRVLSTFIAMAVAFVLFKFIGYYAAVLGLVVLLYIPILVMLKIVPGFVSSVVILLHIFDHKHFDLNLLVNELLIMVIGFGVAFVVNFYMPDIEHKLNQYRIEIENLYSKIFIEIVKYLRYGDTAWDGSELIIVNEKVNKGKSLAYLDVENHLTRKESLYYNYFDIREQQLEIIERILPSVINLPADVSHAAIVADFMEELSENIHSGNTASIYRQKLADVKKEFQKKPLPITHEQFLAMASLYQFIEEMDRYLAIKENFKGLKIKKGRAIF